MQVSGKRTSTNELVIKTADTEKSIVTDTDQIPNDYRNKIIISRIDFDWAKREQEMRAEKLVRTIVQEPPPIEHAILAMQPFIEPILPKEMESIPSDSQQEVSLEPEPKPQQPHRLPCFLCWEFGHVKQFCQFFRAPLTDEMKAVFQGNKLRHKNDPANAEYWHKQWLQKSCKKIVKKVNKMDTAHQDLILYQIHQGRVHKNRSSSRGGI
ncbi:unnamed protein product [Orchesella dallaii]|uniref:Uncharacterized protein n=1 Tax=Orchesella dallaii TaxID=48710 RepID=A0ABP1S7U2_9HEXA